MRATVLLVLVALALGAWVWFYEIRGQEAREAAEAEAGRLLSLAPEDATALSLSLESGGRARLVRDGGAWRLEEPLAYPADGATVENLLRTLAELEPKTSFENGDLSRYGLAEPDRRLEVWAGGEDPIVLELGRETPIGGQVYLRVSGDARVHTIEALRKSTLSPKLSALRDKRVLTLERDAIDALEIARDGALFARLRKSATDGAEPAWRLVAPVEDAADTRRVDRLVQDLVLARASDFVDAPQALTAYGLDAPELGLELGAGDARQRLELGRADDQAWARRDGSAPLFAVAARTLDQVPSELFALRHKTVLEVPVADVAELELAFPRSGGSYRFARRDETWESADPAIEVDPAGLEDLIFTLEDLEATGVEESGADAAALGLEPASVRVTLRDADGGEVAWLVLGDTEPGRGIPARSSQSERVWRVINDLGETVPLGEDAFRNRWLAAADDTGEPEGSPSGELAPSGEDVE